MQRSYESRICMPPQGVLHPANRPTRCVDSVAIHEMVVLALHVPLGELGIGRNERALPESVGRVSIDAPHDGVERCDPPLLLIDQRGIEARLSPWSRLATRRARNE